MTEDIKKALRKALLKVAERVRDRAIDEAPYVKGVLKRSITVHDESEDRVIVSAGGAEAPYAVYVHEGTRPHLIKPKKKKALADKKKGIIFGKRVNHPGSKPNPFLLRAAKKTASDIDRLVGDDIARAAAVEIKKQLKDIKIEVKI